MVGWSLWCLSRDINLIVSCALNLHFGITFFVTAFSSENRTVDVASLHRILEKKKQNWLFKMKKKPLTKTTCRHRKWWKKYWRLQTWTYKNCVIRPPTRKKKRHMHQPCCVINDVKPFHLRKHGVLKSSAILGNSYSSFPGHPAQLQKQAAGSRVLRSHWLGNSVPTTGTIKVGSSFF